ncbi:MAG: hypothetical protein JSV94_05315 [Methanobacteriota archaeon]|nr:MAG: hypothetical protein JSV94_05315 [Euryarchaeota archaeon]
MKFVLLLWILGLWGLLVFCAILNGAFRESVLTPSMGETIGRAISSIILSSVILLVAYVFLLKTSVEYSGTDLWVMGIVWLSLTLLFEVGFGHFVQGKSWDTLLEDYNIFEGRIWILVLIVTIAGPHLMGTLVGKGSP